MHIQLIQIGCALLLAVSSIARGEDRTAPGEEYNLQAVRPGPMDQPWQKCLRQLCGDKLDYIDRELVSQIVSGKGKSNKNIKQLVLTAAAAGRAELADAKQQLENLVQLMRQDKEINSAKALQLNEVGLAAGHLKQVTLNPDGTPDIAATREAMRGESEESIARTLKAAEVLHDVLRKTPLVARESLRVLKQRMSEKEIRNMIVATVADVEKNEQVIALHFGLPRESVCPGVARWSEVKNRLLSNRWDEYDLEQLSERYGAPALIARLIQEFPINSSRPPVKVRSLIEPDVLKSFESMQTSLSEYLAGRPAKDNPWPKAIRAVAGGCLVGDVTVQKYFPTEKTIQSFLPIEMEWRKEYVRHLKGQLSDETMSKVEPFLANVKIDFPKTQAQWRKDVLRDLGRIKNEAKSDWLTRTDETRQIALMVTLLNGRTLDDKLEPLERTKKLCREKGNPISDESDPTSDRVGVGALTIYRPTAGRIVAFHEYSHSLSGFIGRNSGISEKSKEKFDRWRNCVGKMHAGQRKYVEEDYADLLAMNFGKAKLEIGCGRLDDRNGKSFSVQQSDKDDPHSTWLFRLLHGEAILGQVPPVCVEALAAKGEKFEVTNCFDAP